MNRGPHAHKSTPAPALPLPTTPKMSVFYGTIAHTPQLGQLEVLPHSVIAVDESGKIVFLEQNESKLDAIKKAADLVGGNPEIHDFDSQFKFLFPGFIDTHIHASQFPNIGIGSDLELLDWLKDHTFAMENKFKQENLDFSRNVYNRVIRQTLKNGTTCASYFNTIDTATTKDFADLLLKHGQRGFVGKVCMDCNEPYPDYEEGELACVAGMEELIGYCRSLPQNTVTPVVTPRFALACLGELMAKLGALAKKYHLPVQTHISENRFEIQGVAEKFKNAANYADVYDQAGLLLDRTILAHAIHLDPKERQLISEKGCSISHCPISNTFITSGEAPVKQYLYKDNINVSLGTDLLGGFDKSVLGVARAAIMVSHHLQMKSPDSVDNTLSVPEALYMATMGGARACGMADKLGSFQVGKQFDVQMIDLDVKDSNVDVFVFHTGDVLFHKWVFSGDDRNVVGVWVDGKRVVG